MRLYLSPEQLSKMIHENGPNLGANKNHKTDQPYKDMSREEMVQQLLKGKEASNNTRRI